MGGGATRLCLSAGRASLSCMRRWCALCRAACPLPRASASPELTSRGPHAPVRARSKHFFGGKSGKERAFMFRSASTVEERRLARPSEARCRRNRGDLRPTLPRRPAREVHRATAKFHDVSKGRRAPLTLPEQWRWCLRCVCGVCLPVRGQQRARTLEFRNPRCGSFGISFPQCLSRDGPTEDQTESASTDPTDDNALCKSAPNRSPVINPKDTAERRRPASKHMVVGRAGSGEHSTPSIGWPKCRTLRIARPHLLATSAPTEWHLRTL